MTNSLARGIETKVINSVAVVPSDGALSDILAIPTDVRYFSVSIRPVGTYTALVVVIQIANNNVDAEFSDVYTSNAVAGEFITVGPNAAGFVRIKITSSAGAARVGMVIGVNGR